MDSVGFFSFYCIDTSLFETGSYPIKMKWSPRPERSESTWRRLLLSESCSCHCVLLDAQVQRHYLVWFHQDSWLSIASSSVGSLGPGISCRPRLHRCRRLSRVQPPLEVWSLWCHRQAGSGHKTPLSHSWSMIVETRVNDSGFSGCLTKIRCNTELVSNKSKMFIREHQGQNAVYSVDDGLMYLPCTVDGIDIDRGFLGLKLSRHLNHLVINIPQSFVSSCDAAPHAAGMNTSWTQSGRFCIKIYQQPLLIRIQ
jgi:hypothetical protein